MLWWFRWVVAAARGIVTEGGRSGWSAGGRRIDPERILDERFAGGEIDEEDYPSRRGLLRWLRDEDHDERYPGRWRWR